MFCFLLKIKSAAPIWGCAFFESGLCVNAFRQIVDRQGYIRHPYIYV